MPAHKSLRQMVWSGAVKIWHGLGKYAEQLKIVFTIFAAGYIVWEYRSNLTESAIKQTMEFQSRYSKDDLLKAHLELDLMMLNPETQKTLTAAAKPSPVITGMVKLNKYERDVLILADFFGQLATCVQRDICHMETACAVFKDRVDAHWHNYYDLFQQWKPLGDRLMQPTTDYFDKTCK